MTIAHIIENEAARKRAPVPTHYAFIGDQLLSTEWRITTETAEQVLRAAKTNPPADAVRFRMSDGSMVVVKPLPLKLPPILDGHDWTPEEVAMNPTFVFGKDGVGFEFRPRASTDYEDRLKQRETRRER